MSVLSILYTTLIMPLQLMFEVMYMLAERVIGNPGLSIVVLSLMMNFLVLPLYMRADKMQEDERDMEARLHDGVAHIRKTFKGDEKMMMLQTYYRQNGYRPTDVFKGSISLFLEIPFFISAYLFLSHLQILQGVSFWVIPDLGAPDGLVSIGGFKVNVLPFVMTAINLASCIIFTKGMPKKTKVQLYAMAAFFLVFLYNSPSGLVFYWTLNNLFSLVKTVFYKIPHPGRVLSALFACAGAALLVYGAFFYDSPSFKKTLLVCIVGAACMVPAVVAFFRSRRKRPRRALALPNSKATFVTGALFLTVLTGLLIPSAVIGASPQEFVETGSLFNPQWYIVSAFCLAVGTFLVWMSVFYWLTSEKYKPVFQLAVWVLCGVAFIDYMFFGTDLGLLTNTLQYENGLSFTVASQLLNAAVLAGAIVVMYLLFKHANKAVGSVLAIAVAAVVVMSGYNISGIGPSVAQARDAMAAAQENKPAFTLSKNGKNVVVIMLDRGMNEYVPYIMNEKPQLKQQFSGFTYYDNVVSFGGFTNFGTPSLFGGYEYTPVEMNRRSSEPLVEKHNEALKVMPVLFDQNGFDVTVCDPTYAGYRWTPDLSIFDEYPNIRTFITAGQFSSEAVTVDRVQANKRNFFCFSVVKCVPLFAQETLYNKGNYNQGKVAPDSQWVSENALVANGVKDNFMKPYAVLQNLGSMTEITEGDQNTYLSITNDTTHNPIILQEPDYVPADSVNNTEYERQHHDRFSPPGTEPLIVENESQYKHYQANVAALQQIGNWLDYLRQNGVYDNTRIIICADHGHPEHQLASLEMPGVDPADEDLYKCCDTEFYYPILLVKDFDATEFTTDSTFMTNADVPTLATSGLVRNPVNPFTGKAIDSSEKTAHDQYILYSQEWDVGKNNGNTYLPGKWLSVHDDRRQMENWSLVEEPSYE